MFKGKYVQIVLKGNLFYEIISTGFV